MDTSRRERVVTPSQNILIISFLVRIKWTVALSWPACQAVHLFPSSRMTQGIARALITLLAGKRISTSGSNLITLHLSSVRERRKALLLVNMQEMNDVTRDQNSCEPPAAPSRHSLHWLRVSSVLHSITVSYTTYVHVPSGSFASFISLCLLAK